MYRDFTYIDDLIHGVSLLINSIPDSSKNKKYQKMIAFLCSAIRIVNIGNSQSVQLMEFIKTIEEILGKKQFIIFYQCSRRCKGNLG